MAEFAELSSGCVASLPPSDIALMESRVSGGYGLKYVHIEPNLAALCLCDVVSLFC